MTQKRFFISALILIVATTSLIVARVFSQSPTAYFLVAQPMLYPIGLGDSYILPLTDPDDIATARTLITSRRFKIVSAVITVGPDGINRDMLAPDMPEWSWHVTEFGGFADVAPEYCDGNPTSTESEVQNWSEGEEGLICYWSYTIVAEVTESVPNELTTWGEIKALFRR